MPKKIHYPEKTFDSCSIHLGGGEYEECFVPCNHDIRCSFFISIFRIYGNQEVDNDWMACYNTLTTNIIVS
jgi:hypothetical protein